MFITWCLNVFIRCWLYDVLFNIYVLLLVVCLLFWIRFVVLHCCMCWIVFCWWFSFEFLTGGRLLMFRLDFKVSMFIYVWVSCVEFGVFWITWVVCLISAGLNNVFGGNYRCWLVLWSGPFAYLSLDAWICCILVSVCCVLFCCLRWVSVVYEIDWMLVTLWWFAL